MKKTIEKFIQEIDIDEFLYNHTWGRYRGEKELKKFYSTEDVKQFLKDILKKVLQQIEAK